ncbi:MAG: metal ABC transporter permease [Solirubrobacterales bacterium]
MPLASLLDPLGGDFGLLTVLEMLVVGAGCGAVGVWMVEFGRAFLAESFTHALLPGLVLAVLAGASLVAGALAGVVGALVLTMLTERAPRVSPATATSVTVTVLVAAGALLAGAGESPVSLENLLFGDPLASSERDVVVGLVLAIALAAALWLSHERFTALAFDRGSAAALGVRPARTEAALLGLLIFAVVVSANAAGSLLALALITGPALAAIALSRRIGQAIVIAAAIGALCGAGGIYLSYYADWPASAAIALLASFAPAVGGGVAGFAQLVER